MSRAIKRYGTPAYLASQPGAPKRPPRRYSQPELRKRRRAGMTTAHYSGSFSLAREIAEVVNPLARRVAAAPRPGRFGLPVTWMAEYAHELVGTVVGWLAEADARTRTAHLAAEPGKRKFAMQKLIDLAQRPVLPEITNAALADGSWAAALTALADGVDAGLADMLARAYPPNAAGLRGRTSRSEQLARLLGRTLDHAALELERRLDSADSNPEPTPAKTDPRAELAALGVTTD
jgi:hypothetical protein